MVHPKFSCININILNFQALQRQALQGRSHPALDLAGWPAVAFQAHIPGATTSELLCEASGAGEVTALQVFCWDFMGILERLNDRL